MPCSSHRGYNIIVSYNIKFFKEENSGCISEGARGQTARPYKRVNHKSGAATWRGERLWLYLANVIIPPVPVAFGVGSALWAAGIVDSLNLEVPHKISVVAVGLNVVTSVPKII